MMTMIFNKYIDEYINQVEGGELKTNQDIKDMIELVKEKLSQENVFIDNDAIDVAIEKIEEYFPFKLLLWQKFIIALIHCYYDDSTLIWSTFLIMMGRGGGKNGFISAVSWYLTTKFHGIQEYNIDIVANSESQAVTSFEDVYNVIDSNKKLKKAFKYTKEKIIYKKTKSYLKFNTSNAKTKDGLRPGCVVFDEIHEYENYDNIKVFTSALGKKKNPRTFYITTNGYVRGGVLDDYLDLSKEILNGEKPKSRMLPILFHLDNEDEVYNKAMWEKANPSINYFPDLKIKMDEEFENMQSQPQLAIEFMTKRMNLPAQDTFTAVAEWDKILATNQPIPDLTGKFCIGAIDYASIRDFVGVGLLFKVGDKRVWIHHSFVHHKALNIKNRKIKFDIDEAVRRGLCTIIRNEDTIKPEYISNWFLEQSKQYNLMDVVADRYRKSILESKFKEVGLPLSDIGNGYITHHKLAPLIEQLFANEQIIYGDDMMMRWYTNNVYVEIDKKENKSYKKIEPKLRKTDGFFAFIHALSKESEIPEEVNFDIYDCYTY